MATLPTPAEIMEQEMHISDNMTTDIIVANAICFTIACIAVVLRFLARRVARIRFEADDWLILLGLLFTLGVVICAFLGVHYGQGRHAILLKDPPALAKVLLSAQVIWGFAISTTKLSILYLFYRIFFISRNFTIALRVVGIIVIGYCLAQVFACIFQCVPIDSTWKIGLKHHCVNVVVGGTVVAGINALIDFVILLMPLPLLYKMQKPMKQKMQLIGIFCLGGLVCFASVYRTVLTQNFSHSDPSWSDTRPEIWTVVELCIGILSACLPTMVPLFSRRRSRVSSGAERGQEKSDSRGRSNANLHGPSITPPSESQNYAHLGVLGDVKDAHDAQEVGIRQWY